MEHYDMPIGFGMGLSMNPEAMQKFAALSEEKKREIIAGTHSVTSKIQMQQYVNKLISDM